MTEIIPHLFISDCDIKPTLLSNLQIKAIINLLDDTKHAVKTYNFPILDIECQDILSLLPKTNEIIKSCISSNESVLVYCHEGISRSVAIVSGYLLSQGLDHELVKQRHPRSNPNPGFLHQLNVYKSSMQSVKKTMKCKKCRGLLDFTVIHDCSSVLFISELQREQVSGKLYCDCLSKIGQWDWSGSECAGCKEWFAPAFCVVKSKVDYY